MFHVALVAPEIPPNTGNVIRLTANTGCTLHLVGPLGFSMEDRLLRRAGLDYHETACVNVYESWRALLSRQQPPRERLFAFTRHAHRRFDEIEWRPGDWLVFGGESKGLPAAILQEIAPPQQVSLPMRPGQRSLNLSNAVAVAVFEAWRQLGYTGAATTDAR